MKHSFNLIKNKNRKKQIDEKMLWLYFSCLFNLLALMSKYLFLKIEAVITKNHNVSWISLNLFCSYLDAQVLFTYKSNAVLTCTDVTSPTFYKRDSSGQVTSITSDGSKYSISANVLTILKVRKADVGYTYYCNGTAGNPVSFVNQGLLTLKKIFKWFSI